MSNVKVISQSHWSHIRLVTFGSDQPAQLFCETCGDEFCEVCFSAQHRKGTRKRHATKPLECARSEKKARVQEGAEGESTVPAPGTQASNGDAVRSGSNDTLSIYLTPNLA